MLTRQPGALARLVYYAVAGFGPLQRHLANGGAGETWNDERLAGASAPAELAGTGVEVVRSAAEGKHERRVAENTSWRFRAGLARRVGAVLMTPRSEVEPSCPTLSTIRRSCCARPIRSSSQVWR